MKIDDSFVGTRLKPLVRRIDWRETANYAASVNDENDFYFDDEQQANPIAHPMFCSAVTWPVVERIWEFIEADNFPLEILATQVHYSEHIQFFRLVTSGDHLYINGKIAAILPHRAGTRVVIRFDVTDDNNLPVFTEHIGSILRGVACEGPGKGERALPRIETIPMPPSNPDKTSHHDVIWASDVFIDRLRPYIYDGCSNIVFPIHTSKKFARQVGLPGIILQGTATLAFVVRELINHEAGGDPNRIHSLYARFSGMVLPGTGIKIVLLGKKRSPGFVHLFFCVRNAQGAVVIKDGVAVFSANIGP
jgi:acyl dehydratase